MWIVVSAWFGIRLEDDLEILTQGSTRIEYGVNYMFYGILSLMWDVYVYVRLNFNIYD